MLVIFDVNETLSDMSPMAARFEDVGLPGHQAAHWFAGVLRDGFALTVTGQNPAFAEVAAEALRARLEASGCDVDDGVRRVMDAFGELPVHDDVVPGVQALRAAGARVVTLSNGSTGVADGLLSRSGIRGEFDRLLSVADAPAWKPDPAAYRYALEACAATAGEAVLIAVHPWDIDGAARAGLRTGWLNRTGAHYPSYFTQPEATAADLVDLAARLCG